MSDVQQGSYPVLFYHQYVGGRDSQTVYTTHHYCGACRQHMDSCYAFPKYPEQLEAENEADGLDRWTHERNKQPLEYIRFCPWCGVQFEDEWWKARTIQNERAIDHYQNPGTHKGDTHEFTGSVEHHWLSVSGGSRLCWCDPEVEPGIMGCVIRHQDKRYEDVMAVEREMSDDA